jgi:hypothetical protein
VHLKKGLLTENSVNPALISFSRPNRKERKDNSTKFANTIFFLAKCGPLIVVWGFQYSGKMASLRR